MGQRLEPDAPRRRSVLRSCVQGIALVTVLFALGCGNIRDAAEELFDHRTPRQRYVDALNAAGLRDAALTLDWVAAAERSMADAPLVTSPHEEQGYLEPGEPSAIALRIRVRRGQELSLEVELPGDSSTAMFLDAWSIEGDTSRSFNHLVSADSGERFLRLTPRRDGEIVVRAQPELLRGGRFRALLRIGPTLAFPVQPGTDRDIGSRFGAPRDAGARSHHGIDIFARRGTPVVAAASGVVNRVNETNIGGKVVWVRDVFGNSLYYAHLDSQVVSSGMRVDVGDTLGFVGNTGNARTTPPHLHFGVYRRGEGPVDPYWFVYRPRGSVPRLVADTVHLGRWVRASVARATLRTAPSLTADTVTMLERQAAMRVLSAAGEWYRVRLPDGVTGFVSARATESAERAIGAVSVGQTILARPAVTHTPSDVVAIVEPGETVGVLGRFGDFSLVRTRWGVAGWVLQQ
jgi:murein DD-endopeptidase MepM/ murein hydrolase activator NlpD/SH3-like domain-containing protein